MSDDLHPVAEPEAKAAAGGGTTGAERALPFLWTAVALLLITAVAAAVLGWADPRSPAQRVAAAGTVATAEGARFERPPTPAD